jgi:hypothetical protein
MNNESKELAQLFDDEVEVTDQSLEDLFADDAMTDYKARIARGLDEERFRREYMDDFDAVPNCISYGFTGTQRELTPEQGQALATLLGQLAHSRTYPMGHFHHGDCVGADERAARIVNAITPQIAIHEHPGVECEQSGKRALAHTFCRHVVVYQPLPNRARNEIIASQDALIAVPRTMSEIMRSGTWTTVRMFAAKFYGERPIYFVWPNGVVSMTRQFKSVLTKQTVRPEEAQEWLLI